MTMEMSPGPYILEIWIIEYKLFLLKLHIVPSCLILGMVGIQNIIARPKSGQK